MASSSSHSHPQDSYTSPGHPGPHQENNPQQYWDQQYSSPYYQQHWGQPWDPYQQYVPFDQQGAQGYYSPPHVSYQSGWIPGMQHPSLHDPRHQSWHGARGRGGRYAERPIPGGDHPTYFQPHMQHQAASSLHDGWARHHREVSILQVLIQTRLPALACRCFQLHHALNDDIQGQMAFCANQLLRPILIRNKYQMWQLQSCTCRKEIVAIKSD